MKAATIALQTAVKQEYELHAVPKLVAEWEHNRYSVPTVSVSPDQNATVDWDKFYDLDSIALPNRPAAGAAKARFDPTNKVKLSSSYRDTPNSARFYIATEDDPYKYWASTQKAGTTATGGSYYFVDPIELSVVYPSDVIANKIVVGFETSYSQPVVYTIEISLDGTSWTTVATNPVIDEDGRATLWFDGIGWTNILDYSHLEAIRGVKVVVYSMANASTKLEVIQIGARLENDLSDLLEGYQKSFELSDRSFIAPLGKASANEASVSLNNNGGIFNNENEDSIYFGLIGKKAKFTLDLSYDCTATGGGSDERIREFTMWVDSWGASDDDASMSVSLKDSSIFLQEASVPKVFWEGSTIGAVIWQMMDILGMSNYYYTRSVLDTGQVVTYFWPQEGSDTAWDMISKLSEGTQTAVYFDEYDVMQIRTRKSMFHSTANIDWNFDAIQNGSKLPDVVSTQIDNSLAANEVNIKYKPAHYSDFNNGLPKMETVWQPEEETVALRASALMKDLLIGGTNLWITQADAAFWPYESDVNIRGEVLHFKGKEYCYNSPSGKVYDVVYSLDDKTRFDSLSNPDLLWANAFTGKLLVTERNIGGTGEVNHTVKANNYVPLITTTDNTAFYQASSNPLRYVQGYASIVSPLSSKTAIALVVSPAVVNSHSTTYGFRFRFPTELRNSDGWICGGMTFAADNADGGFYLEISPTDTIELEKRAIRHEISICGMKSNQKQYRLDRGMSAAIARGAWYSVDVRHVVNTNGTVNISVFLDGVLLREYTNIATSLVPPDAGRLGLFVRGYSNMDVEYLYAVHQVDANPPDASTFLDLESGGYTSGYIQRDWKYGGLFTTSSRGPAGQGGKWLVIPSYRAEYMYDEFEPLVHEIREFEVAFDDQKIPVIHSSLYVSNDSKVYCTNYWSDPFGAKFTLANAARQTAIVNGDDDSLGPDNVISQKMIVYGRALYQDDDQTVTKKDDASIRRNGTVSLDFDNPYIQTKENADDLAQWIIDEWSQSGDEIDMEVFGNPLVQLGDLVTVNYPVKGMLPSTHHYYIVSLNNSFDTGLTTNLILRRARI